MPGSLILYRVLYLRLRFSPLGIVFLLVLESPFITAILCAWVPYFVWGTLLRSQFPLGNIYFYSLSRFVLCTYLLQGSFHGCFGFLHLVAVFPFCGHFTFSLKVLFLTNFYWYLGHSHIVKVMVMFCLLRSPSSHMAMFYLFIDRSYLARSSPTFNLLSIQFT